MDAKPPLLSEPTTRRLCIQARKGNACARDRLLRAHMGLVIYVARCFFRPGAFLEFEDLVQQGCLGLLRAIEKFNPQKRSRGKRVRFASYAHWWVAHGVRREIQNHGRTIAVPIPRLREVLTSTVSLDAVGEENGAEHSRVWQIADENDTPENWCRAWEARLLAERLLVDLPPPFRAVINHRYSLTGQLPALSQKQIGEKLGVCGSRISQWERQGIYLMQQSALGIAF